MRFYCNWGLTNKIDLFFQPLTWRRLGKFALSAKRATLKLVKQLSLKAIC